MQPPDQILIVDDELNLRLTLRAILDRAGYRVTAVGHAREALYELDSQPFDAMIVDLKMPDIDGLSLLDQARQKLPNLPVIILTAHASIESAVGALRLRADEYLHKPVPPPVLLERLAAVLEEHRHQPPPALANDGRIVQCGPFTLNSHTRSALLAGRLLTLSPTSFDYLLVLARHAPHPASAEDLVQAAQGYLIERYQALEIARWHIHQLRQAIEPDPKQPVYILTVRRVGYRLAV